MKSTVESCNAGDQNKTYGQKREPWQAKEQICN